MPNEKSVFDLIRIEEKGLKSGSEIILVGCRNNAKAFGH